jgi:uncharacterized protein (DUF697 family)
MARFSFLTDTWSTIKEVDLRPLREQALKGVSIYIVGAPGSGRFTLADQMRRDPSRPELEAETPVTIMDLENGKQSEQADMIILMMDSRKADSSAEQELVKYWHNSGKRVLVFINQPDSDQPGENIAISPWTSHGKRRVVWGSVNDIDFLLGQFASTMIEILRDQLMTLGRNFPLFRVPIANYLINDTCFSNAAYALSTGLAETVAVLDIPIAVTDMIILSKNQAYLAYKLGLALGYSTRWQDYIAEFGSVLGGGFVWRQIARTLVGFIPVWGIVPKTAISYAGTYVVGHAILGWYLTGRHVSKKQLNQLYTQALARGRKIAGDLLDRIPHPRLPKLTRPNLPRLPRPRLPRRRSSADETVMSNKICQNCGQLSAPDASFCQYCAHPFIEEPD